MATAIEMLHISLTGNRPRTIQLRSINSTTQALGSILSTLTLENPSDGNSRLAADNGLSYLPYRLGTLGGDTAILLINMEMIFSYYVCNQVSPICHLFTYGRDSLHFGKPFFDVSDIGDNWAPFLRPTNMAGTYGFGVLGCSTFDSACVSEFEVTVVCLLPPDHHDQCG